MPYDTLMRATNTHGVWSSHQCVIGYQKSVSRLSASCIFAATILVTLRHSQTSHLLTVQQNLPFLMKEPLLWSIIS